MTTLSIPGYEDIAKSGWLPQLAAVPGASDNPLTRGNTYLRLIDYIDGDGTKPTAGIGMYLSPTALVVEQEDATNISPFNGEQIREFLLSVGITIDLPVINIDGTDEGRMLVAEGTEWVKGYAIEVVDAEPADPGPNTIYFVRES